MSFFPPWPERKQESVGNAHVPDIGVALGTEGAAVTGDESQVVAEVVVEAEVEALCVDCGQTVASAVHREELLHAGDGLCIAKDLWNR